MASTRRMGVENSEIRAQLIEAASQLIRDEGCSAVTARRLAEKIDLKRQIVHYYFGTIEDLLIAVIRRDGERIRERLVKALESDEPLRVSWELTNKDTATILELSAMAARREAIRAEVQRYTVEFRKIQTQALARHLERHGIKPAVSPVVTTIIVNSIAQALAVESSLGISEGHAETKALVQEWLREFAESGKSLITAP